MKLNPRVPHVGMFLLLVAAANLLSGCATAQPPSSSEHTAGPPIVLYWASQSATLVYATHIVNAVWVGNAADHPDENPANHQDAWIDRGVVPLDWAGGRVYADRGVDGLVRKWSGSLEKGHVGIAIDEFGSRERGEDKVLASALVELRRRYPDAYLAVWHAGLITNRVAAAYHQAADLVMLETYVSGDTALGLKFGVFLASARRFGLQHRTVPVVALGDARFAETYDQAVAQLDWLHANASDFRGIAIYAPKVTPDLVREVDSYIGSIYR